jgi:hypothetical protein
MMASAMFSGRLGATQKGIAGIGRNAVMRPQQFVDVIGFGGSDDA